jgi:HKD family nuclease
LGPMTWHLQSPGFGDYSLIKFIEANCKKATCGAAVFAFATSAGVKLFFARPSVISFLQNHKFQMVVGLDAITDTAAIAQLSIAAAKYPNLNIRVFKHNVGGVCFHPKTMWFETGAGGVTITGSGNLTTGGLEKNWEAFSVETATAVDMTAVKTQWKEWSVAHQDNLLPLDHPDVEARAKSNKKLKAKIAKAAQTPEGADEDAAVEGAADAVEEVNAQLALRPVLVAEVPKASDRWKQINFDKKTFQEFFGVTIGKPKTVKFYHANDDGSFDPPETSTAVAVKSRNFRFEIGAAAYLAYPANGHPIVIFERLNPAEYSYVLLMPGKGAHALVQKYLDDNYGPAGNKKRRIVMTASDLAAAWPDCPLLK